MNYVKLIEAITIKAYRPLLQKAYDKEELPAEYSDLIKTFKLRK